METVKIKMDWVLVLWYLHLHFLGLCGFWQLLVDAKWMTVLFAIFTIAVSYIGITVAAHRYYAHKTFQATSVLRLFFVAAHTLAGVGNLHDWVLLHRIHHKYFGTDKDPYDFNKGFIYSHFTSNCQERNLQNCELVKTIDMRDIENEGFVWLQHKLYWILFALITLLFPINIPVAYWDESIWNSILILFFFRLLITTHVSWLVNSAIIVWGLKPTDKFPVDDFSVFYVYKSYWPNYHYIFPRDWKSSEFGKYNSGCGTLLIKFCYETGLLDTLTSMSSKDVREILYKIADKKISVTNAMDELDQLSMKEAVRQQLRYRD